MFLYFLYALCMTTWCSEGHVTNASCKRTHQLQWRHNGRDIVSNHQPHDCSLKRLFRRRSKKTTKLRVTGLCVGNSPETGEFSAQMASNAENVSIWWRHHRQNMHCLPIVSSVALLELKQSFPVSNLDGYSQDWQFNEHFKLGLVVYKSSPQWFKLI